MWCMVYGRYCSDLGKAFNVPIFHCNGDDPIAVVEAFEMAVEWRQVHDHHTDHTVYTILCPPFFCIISEPNAKGHCNWCGRM